jgi:precorrin-6B methylase 1
VVAELLDGLVLKCLLLRAHSSRLPSVGAAVLAAAAIVVGFASVLAMVKPLTSEWIDHLDRRSPGELRS